jgi:hypothetical protein
MRWRWSAAAPVLALVPCAVACRGLLGLQEPIVEDDAGDAGLTVDADNGEASAVYPAFPNLAVPRLTGQATGVIALPQVRAVVFAGDALAQQIAAGSPVWLGSSTWSTQTLEYGVAPGVTLPTVTLSETAPPALTDDDVQAWLAGELDGTHPEFGPADTTTLASEVFVIVYPADTTVTTSAGTSCQQFNGYHGELALGTARVTYIVLPRCDGLLTTLSVAGTYELLATVTNPRPVALPDYATFDPRHTAWNFLGGSDGGNGQTELPQPCCVPSRDGCTRMVTVVGDAGVVARSWSNGQIEGYHDPCVPTPDSTPYFASVPIMNDLVSPPGLFPTNGIQLQVHKSKTVEVWMFSDGPTSGPWSVAATILAGPANALGFAFDRDAGTNGEKLHLTVTANQAGSFPFALVSTLGAKQTTWVGIAGQE